MRKSKVPARLYKYREFNDATLDLLISDRLFFADPSKFNDPLDSNPSIDADILSDEMELVLRKLVETRVASEMRIAAKAIGFEKSNTFKHIRRQSLYQANRLVDEIRYQATNPDYEFDDPLLILFAQYVEGELLRRYEGGIVSLTEREDCPLMWSHYGDQHHGIAIGYSIPEPRVRAVHKIKYGGSRLIQASKIAAMLDGDEEAKREVDAAVLLKKAHAWRYEKEWRLVGKRGVQDSILEMEEVVFGLRCPVAVRYAVLRALEEREPEVKFYEIRQQAGRFILKKYLFDSSEILALLPRRATTLF